jgi:hypothetical protein
MTFMQKPPSPSRRMSERTTATLPGVDDYGRPQRRRHDGTATQHTESGAPPPRAARQPAVRAGITGIPITPSHRPQRVFGRGNVDKPPHDTGEHSISLDEVVHEHNASDWAIGRELHPLRPIQSSPPILLWAEAMACHAPFRSCPLFLFLRGPSPSYG